MVDIIVPVYNAELYIERCIRSILKQTYMNWQLWLVNDGSLDKSEIICTEFSQKYANIFVVSKKNAGVSSARNIGLKKATGKYVCFVDSDDWLEPRYLESLITQIGNADICIGNGYIWDRDGPYRLLYDNIEDIRLDSPEDKINFLFSPYGHLVWGRIYHRECLELFFDEDIRYGEDIVFNYNLLKKGIQIKLVNYTGYNHIINKKGICLSHGAADPTDMIYAITHIYHKEIDSPSAVIYNKEWCRYVLGRLLQFFLNRNNIVNTKIDYAIHFIHKYIKKIRQNELTAYQSSLLSIFERPLTDICTECNIFYDRYLQALKSFSRRYIYIYIYMEQMIKH